MYFRSRYNYFIGENGSGRRMMLLMLATICASLSSGGALSFFHSGSALKACQQLFALGERVEGEHVGDVGLAGADDGFADEDRAHAEALEDADLAAVEHRGLLLARGEGLRLVGAELEDARRGGWRHRWGGRVRG